MVQWAAPRQKNSIKYTHQLECQNEVSGLSNRKQWLVLNKNKNLQGMMAHP